MPQLSLFFLGAPRVQHQGRWIEFDRHKSLALLAYLAPTGQPHRRDSLATLFWPDLDQRRARAGLRRVLSSLQGALPGTWWEVERETVSMRPGPELWCDVAQFGHLLSVVRAHRHSMIPACADCRVTLAEAVALYRGDFLAGFSLRGCAAFDEWQMSQGESMRAALSAALDQLVQANSAQGEFETATAHARRWLALDPLHEPAQQQLMRLLAWSGQRTAALRQYDACVRLLDAELGVSPHEKTVQLYRAIRDDQLAPPEPQTSQSTTADITTLNIANRVHSVRPTPLAGAASPEHQVTLDHMTSGGFVGRELELTQASATWQEAVGGQGQVLLVSGEPGIGKTHLVHELARLAKRAGGRVLMGECSSRGELPYAPFAQIAGDILDQVEFDPALTNDMRIDLNDLMPLRSARHERPRSENLPDPDIERQRLFDSFTSTCRAAAGSAPLLLVVEDIHWADAGTFALLHHLASQIGQSRILLLVTYRDTEVYLSEPRGLPEMLLELNREHVVHNIRLGRLNRQQSGRMLAALLGTSEVSEVFRDGLFDETEGNPFFMEEVCKALIEQGKLYIVGDAWQRDDMRSVTLPQTVREAILARVGRLSALTQEVLQSAAVLGRDFDLDLLRTATRRDEAVLLSALEPARRAQLIVANQFQRKAGQAHYRFAHALIPFALREALGGLRLQRQHRRVAQAIEQLQPDAVEILAAHYTAAGDQAKAKALTYTLQAASRAQALYDDETAIYHLRSALHLAETGEMRLAVLEQLGDEHLQRDGNADAARAYQEALEIEATHAGADPLLRVRLLRKLAEAVWITENIKSVHSLEPAADAALDEGLDLMASQPAHSETVRLLTARAHSAWRGRVPQDWAAAERDTRQAVALAEQLDAPVELSAALESLATVLAARNSFRERAEVALRRVTLTTEPKFAATGERARALKEAGAALIDVGEYAQARHYLEEAERLARRMHAAEDIIVGLGLQARCALALDQWDDVFMEGKLRAMTEQPTSHPLRPVCVHQALMSSVHALRGEEEASAMLRDESVAFMIQWYPAEGWGRGQHY